MGDADDALMVAVLEHEGHEVSWHLWDEAELDWGGFDVVVVRSTWDYQRRRDEFLRWAERVPVLRNPAPVLAWNTDKRYLAELGPEGIAAIETTYLPPGSLLPPGGNKEPDGLAAGEVVIKPTVSAGSKDTARFDLSDPAAVARAEALTAEIHGGGRTAMVQPYISSVDEQGETALLYFGGEFSHAIGKGPLLRPGEGPTEGFFAPETVEPREATAAELALGAKVAKAIASRFGDLLYARVDLVAGDRGEPIVLEVELTEPSLFFAHSEGAARRFAQALPYSL